MLDPSHDADLQARVHKGFIVESEDQMTPGYKKALLNILLVQADTELMSAPAYYSAAKDAPTLASRIAVSAIIQDELGHANIAYRIMEDLGESKHDLVYGRAPEEFKNPYGFDQPLENWAEMAVANGFFDRAGICLLGDIYKNTSYGPWKRALTKIDKEEYFHLRHGESWMRRLSKAGGVVKEKLQGAVDWMFPTGIEWFGMPDTKKRHSAQLAFKLKGMTNDQLRQKWMESVVPLCQEIGIRVPAHLDEERKEYVLEYDLPCEFDPVAKRWLFDQPITWERVFERWKNRGPMNRQYAEMIQGRANDLFGARAWSEGEMAGNGGGEQGGGGRGGDARRESADA
ncbi:MAG: phenylacetate-CoA oxygenase subunit PaaI [Gemmatimonadetes bacterium]|nr:phenylacetate-CoA oxygenase subunit PaaI [Gemmatimonadota bacterium]